MVYPVYNTVNTEFMAGYITTLVIDMRKTPVVVSATVEPWINQSPISLTLTPISIGGTPGVTDEFFQDKSIRVYKWGSDFKEVTYTYVPEASGSTTYTWMGNENIYWEDLNGQTLSLTAAYYPGDIPVVSSTTTSITGDLPRDQSAGYEQYDILMATYSSNVPAYINLPFTHIYSKIRVEIVANAGEFTNEELLGAEVTLNNFIQAGSISLTTGTAIAGTNNRADIIP
ncbi:MAG: fimbrillin family protein [Rikenellaceae bacterium]|nr:fimbrillin family protein [Rikenellaceae bacterium]